MKNNSNISKTILLYIFITLFSFEVQAQVVVIDPGHGYTSTGADPDGRTDTEHSTALAVGLKLRRKLQNSCGNWTVRMTRTIRNGWVSVSQRRVMSNNWRADRFISIHCNGGGGTGTETFWSKSSTTPNASNSRFSREVQDEMVSKGQWVDRRSSEDRPYLGYTLGVLRNNNAIGILSEIGFVDSSDKSKLLNNTWRERFADAYVSALQKSLGNCSGSGGGDGGGDNGNTDTQAPTTSISASGGNTQTGDFTVNFSDKDNVGVTRKFYQVLEKYSSNWYANRNNGFFNDNFNVFYSGYTTGDGNWTINQGRLRQSNTVSDNTRLSSYLAQNSGLPYLYEFAAKIGSTSGPRKFGIHIMSDDGTQTQRGNSYLIWFSGEDNKVRIYETVNNVLNFRAIGNVTLDDKWANYKVTYSPSFGVLEIFRNNKSVLRWTDASPIKSGSSISLRTNKTVVEFDDLKVYKFRAGNSQTITVGSSSSKDLRRSNGKIKSLVRDAAGNWSTSGNLDITVSSLENKNFINDVELVQNTILLYPNPTDGHGAILQFPSVEAENTIINIYDILGKKIKEITHKGTTSGVEKLTIDDQISDLSQGRYLIKVSNSRIPKSTITLIKQ